MSHSCEFITGGQGDGWGNSEVHLCDAPASIKYYGRWYCAEHYDFVEANSAPPGVYTTEVVEPD